MQRLNVRIVAFVVLGGSLLFSQVGDGNRATFYFGGKPFYVGMPKKEALTSLSICCRLSPSADSEIEKQPRPAGRMLGHFILPKEESQQPILGAIYFSNEQVARISRELASSVDTYSPDLVAFMRAFKRALPDGETSAVVSLQHERITNAESDVVTIVFRNGRGLEVHLGTLDQANPAGMRDFVTIEETLQSVR